MTISIIDMKGKMTYLNTCYYDDVSAFCVPFYWKVTKACFYVRKGFTYDVKENRVFCILYLHLIHYLSRPLDESKLSKVKNRQMSLWDISLLLSVNSLTGNVAKLIFIYIGHEVVYKLVLWKGHFTFYYNTNVMYLVLRFRICK